MESLVGLDAVEVEDIRSFKRPCDTWAAIVGNAALGERRRHGVASNDCGSGSGCRSTRTSRNGEDRHDERERDPLHLSHPLGDIVEPQSAPPVVTRSPTTI